MNDEMVHPFVRRLEGDLINHLPVGQFDPRFKMITRSLAIPVSLLAKAGDQVLKSKIQASFNEALIYLRTLDASESDLDLDFIKFQVSRWMQLGVGDDNSGAGHKVLTPNDVISTTCRNHLFGGVVRSLIRTHVARAKQHNAKSIGILASFLLSKLGWPKLSKSKLLESVASHQKYLTSVPAPISDELSAKVSQVVHEIVKPTRLYGKLNPTRNACYQNSIKNGGARGMIVSAPFSLDERVEFGPGAAERAVRLNEHTLRSIADMIGKYKSKIWVDVRKSIEDPLSLPGDFFLRAARVQVIPEPGKFRIITAGDAYLYTYLQPLQGHLLDQWKRSPYSTMIPEWEKKVEGWKAPRGWVWNSGDYKAATDQLNGNATRTAITTVQDVLDIKDVQTDLISTWLQYPKKDLDPILFEKGELSTLVRQTTGQLMGHPLSFPILCLINLAGLKCALQRGVKLKILSVIDCALILSMTLINGDDILFPCPPQLCPVWETAASELGLKLSIGKSYASAYFAMVNNKMFIMGPEGGRRVGYVNQRLILNYSLKKGSGERKLSPIEIGHAFNEMFETFPPSVDFLPDAVKRRRDLTVAGYIPNFFIPCELGGLGIKVKWATHSIRMSRQQRQVAALCAEGVMNSFCISEGASTKLEKMVRKILPSVKLTTGANATNYLSETGGRWSCTQPGNPLLFPESVQLNSSSSYKSWTGLVSSVIDPKPTAVRRLKKMVGVRPMSKRKCLTLLPRWLFPILPHAETGFFATYWGSKPRKCEVQTRSLPSVDDGRDEYLNGLCGWCFAPTDFCNCGGNTDFRKDQW